MIQVGKTITIKEDIINNFDVSIVMPFYKKLKEFKRVFPTNFHYAMVDAQLALYVSRTDIVF